MAKGKAAPKSGAKTPLKAAIPPKATPPHPKSIGKSSEYEFDDEDEEMVSAAPLSKPAARALISDGQTAAVSAAALTSKLTSQLDKCTASLKSPPKSKDALLKVLKSARQALEQLPQERSSLGNAQDVLPEYLIAPQLTGHDDKDVRLYVTLCLAELLRVFAPETPFDDDGLLVVFRCVLWAFGRLEQAKAPTFDLCQGILRLVAMTKAYMVMLDINDGELVPRTFTALLGSAREDNLEAIEVPAIEVLSGLLLELGDVPPAVLDAILVALQKAEERPAGLRLVQGLIRGADALLRPALQKYLTEAVLGGEGGELSKDAHMVLLQLYRAAPNVLLPIVPHLRGRLGSDDVDIRSATAELISELLQVSGSDLAAAFPDVLQEWLLRYQDTDEAVRLQMMGCVGTTLTAMSHHTDVQAQLLHAVEARLRDISERVRIEAVKVLCGVEVGSDVRQAHTLMPSTALQGVSDRLRDKKLAVRKEAVVGLLAVFRSYCVEVVKGGFSDNRDPHAVWIPSRLASVAVRDVDVRKCMIDVMAQHAGFLPTGVPDAVGAAIWALVYNETEAGDNRAALCKLLYAKCHAALCLQAWLRARERVRAAPAETDAAAHASAQARLQSACAALLQAATGCIPRLQQCIGKLTSDVKDNTVFQRLATLCDMRTTPTAFAAARKDCLSRLPGGSKSHLAESMTALLNLIQPNLLSLGHWKALLYMVARGGPDAEDAAILLIDAAGSAANLAAVTTDVAANLLQPPLPSHATSCRKPHKQAAAAHNGRKSGAESDGPDDGELDGSEPEAVAIASAAAVTVAAVVLSKSALLYRSLKAVDKPALPAHTLTALVSLCTGSAPKAAKAAVPAIVHLSDSAADADTSLKQLAKSLMQELLPDSMASLSTACALQALSSIGRLMPIVLAGVAAELVAFLLEQYLPADLEVEALDLDILQSSAFCSFFSLSGLLPSNSVILKCAAMKAVAKSLCPDSLPPPPPQALRTAAGQLLQAFQGLGDLHADSTEAYGLITETDAAHLRAAGFAACLRLARRHDSIMSAPLYCQLSLILQDPVVAVRQLTAQKVRRLLNVALAMPQPTNQLGPRYAAFLALAGMDPYEPNKRSAAQCLHSYIARKRILAAAAAATLATSTTGTTSNKDIAAASTQHGNPEISKAASSNQAAQAAAGLLAQQPEYLLPYAVYLLAHHPDFPMADEEDEAPDVDAYQPFQVMLQFVLEPLLASGSGVEAGAALPAVRKIMHCIKATMDAAEVEDRDSTFCIHLLCDMATEIAVAIVSRDATASGRNKKSQAAAAALEALLMAEHPGRVSLPVKLYQVVQKGPDGKRPERLQHGSHLPAAFEVRLDPNVAELYKAIGGITHTVQHTAFGGGAVSRAAKRPAAAAADATGDGGGGKKSKIDGARRAKGKGAGGGGAEVAAGEELDEEVDSGADSPQGSARGTASDIAQPHAEQATKAQPARRSKPTAALAVASPKLNGVEEGGVRGRSPREQPVKRRKAQKSTYESEREEEQESSSELESEGEEARKAIAAGGHKDGAAAAHHLQATGPKRSKIANGTGRRSPNIPSTVGTTVTPTKAGTYVKTARASKPTTAAAPQASPMRARKVQAKAAAPLSNALQALDTDSDLVGEQDLDAEGQVAATAEESLEKHALHARVADRANGTSARLASVLPSKAAVSKAPLKDSAAVIKHAEAQPDGRAAGQKAAAAPVQAAVAQQQRGSKGQANGTSATGTRSQPTRSQPARGNKAASPLAAIGKKPAAKA